jgi:molybdopterin converting factor small subunit
VVQVHFTAHLRAVTPLGAVTAQGPTIGAVLADVFERHPAAKGYVLDDQGRVRVHIAVFLDGEHVRRDILDRAVKPDSELYILQALSGG